MTRRAVFRCGGAPSHLFFVEIGHLSLWGRPRKKECTKSCRLFSKITFFALHFWVRHPLQKDRKVKYKKNLLILIDIILISVSPTKCLPLEKNALNVFHYCTKRVFCCKVLNPLSNSIESIIDLKDSKTNNFIMYVYTRDWKFQGRDR